MDYSKISKETVCLGMKRENSLENFAKAMSPSVCLY